MTTERQAAWGIPAAELTALGDLYATAQALLRKASEAAERTSVVTAELQEAFKAFCAAMRRFRDRWFKIPPLTLGDWIALGFREKDTQKSLVPPPQGAPLVTLSYPGGPHVITVHLGPLPGMEELNPASDYGFAIYVGIMPAGGATLEEAASEKHYLRAPPKDGNGLKHLRFTRRRKENLILDAEDAGKTAYVCARYENGKGEAGPWGPVASIIIP
jgi:hypothetical protein